MKTLVQHVEHVRGKPEHIRKQVAFAVAAAATAVVALVWFLSTVTAGVFAIQGSSFAESTSGNTNVAAVGPSDSSLLGAASAALGFPQAEPAHIVIVDASTSTPKAEKHDPTVIPF